MLQKGSQMFLLWALALVWLTCGFTIVCESAIGANAGSKNDCFRRKSYVCCENCLHPGAGLSCCGQKAFNPAAATCCKVGHGNNITAHVTQGLSEKVSACCGLKAYNSLNEICCQSTIVAKPAPRAQCCGNEAFDEDEQMCCGRNRVILKRESTHHQCCGHGQYDTRTQCCCVMNEDLNIQPINSSCCGEDSAHVTQGLSKKVSAFCGRKAYNSLNEICCQSTIVAKPAPRAQCCGNEAFDEDEQMCCGRNRVILKRESTHHQCCGHGQYDTRTQCCCVMNEDLNIQPINSSCCGEDSAHVTQGLSKKVSAFCGRKAYNSLNEICCQSTIVAKPAPRAQCCGNEAFDEDEQMCCGRNRVILKRESTHHQCCGHGQYDTRTQCCCVMNEDLNIQPINSSCCVEDSGVQQQKPRPQPNCTSPCGSSCYNPNESRCCKRNQSNSRWCCTPGRCDAVPTVYNPQTHVCCDGCVSERKPWIDQCCGDTPYGLAQHGVLCCNNTLYKDREDGEECSEMHIPYNPAKGTTCCSQFHGSPGQHCCGTEVYKPHIEICCDGHRHPTDKENMHCCGVTAYNIKDPEMKCCAGTLYNLRLLGKVGHDARCCGSILQKPMDVCCSSEDKELLYTNKTGFRCCGHLYYNTSLWSCCAGMLSPVHQPGKPQSKMIKESRLLSVNNLNETDLCQEMRIGIVESVSLDSIVFSSVLEIYGRNGTVKPLPSPYILNTTDRCNSPKLIPGKTYFLNINFEDFTVFTDFYHDSILQSLHFIIFKCIRR